MPPQLPYSLVETDAQLLPIVRRMEDVGILCDLDHFKYLSAYLTDLRDQTDDEIRALGGPENPGSSDQVADWLYNQLHARAKKRTQSGRGSTQDKYLEATRKDPRTRPEVRNAIDKILHRREIDVLKTRYADPMPSLIREDGRLHARILYTRTDTGRFAAKDPNVLAFPKHSDLGLLVRHGFVPAAGRCLAEWDLAQVEMRMLAADSCDETMVAQICSGIDFHLATASDVVYRKPADQITKHERFTAKAVNFGVLMGITEVGLADQLRKNGVQTDETACSTFLKNWMRGYPDCAAYIASKHAEARRYGYVTNWRGRRRWLPAVHSPDERISAEALRQAQATPIQGGAAEIFKLWLVEVWGRIERMRAAGIYVELLLPVHDAMLFEVDDWAYELLDAEIKDALDTLQMFPVPITCADSGRGYSWGEV